MIKQFLTILAFGVSLAGAINLSDLIRQPIDRSAVNSDATETAMPESTETPLPECPANEVYSVDMMRCWIDETEARMFAPGLEETIAAEATYETPAPCGWYIPDYSTAIPPPTPIWVCSGG